MEGLEGMNQDLFQAEDQLHRIGTLKEKTLHSVIKNYIEPDPEHQEVKLGRYYVDILHENEIIEVQTQGFHRLCKKLECFLPDYKVTVVYPMAAEKWICWINEETGEVSKKRKSPIKGSYYRSLYELYKIKPFLTDPNLRIRLMLINMEEYRLLNGWSADKKRGSTRHDRIPTEIVDEYTLAGMEDYQKLIPEALGESFTRKDYARESKLSLKVTSCAVNVLKYVGAIEQVGKQGRAFLYQRKMKEKEL